MKRTLLFGAIGILCLGIISFENKPLANEQSLQSIQDQLALYHSTLPSEKIYLHFDRPFYKPGDDIWFSGYLQDGTTHQASDVSKILYVELINPKGNVVHTRNLLVREGTTKGDFKVEENWPGGIYKVRAYTNWMANFGEDLFFEKDIQIQGVMFPKILMTLEWERKAYGAGDKAIAIFKATSLENHPLANIPFGYKAQLHGKDLFTGTSKTDATGKALVKIDLPPQLQTDDGLVNIIIDDAGVKESISRSIPILLKQVDLQFLPEGGNWVAGMESNIAFKALNQHGKPADVEGIVMDGKGATVATFTSYHDGMGVFKVKGKAGVAYTAKITKPEGIDKVYPLPKIVDQSFALQVATQEKDKLALNIYSPEQQQVSMVAQVRGKICWSKAFTAKQGEQTMELDTKDFPMGIAQITLFDRQTNPVCERLVFVKKDEQLNIAITTNKDQYLPREKVKMDIAVTDQKGKGVPGNFSLAVADDKLITFADDKQDNILSYLLMSSDLKGEVHEPNFYFKEDEPKAAPALDYVLLTHGWRRFDWKEILPLKEKDLQAQIKFEAERPLVRGTVLFQPENKPAKNATVIDLQSGRSVKTDQDGKFVMTDLDLSSSRVLRIRYRGFSQDLHVSQFNMGAQQSFNKEAPEADKGFGDALEVDLNKPMKKEVMEIQEVNVQAAQKLAPAAIELVPRMAGVALDEVQIVEFAEPDLPMPEPAMPKMRMAPRFDGGGGGGNGVVRTARGGGYHRSPKALGARYRGAVYNHYELEMDTRWQTFYLQASQDPTGRGNAIFYKARQFYAPKYTSKEVEKRTDFRKTIYWEPNIATDENGKASVTFYNNDEVSSFKATLEGVADNGTVGRTEMNFHTQMPFSMITKIPPIVTFGDRLSIPVTLRNNTEADRCGTMTVIAPEGFVPLEKVESDQLIEPGGVKTLFLNYQVPPVAGKQKFEIRLACMELYDAFEQEIEVLPRGFPVNVSIAGEAVEQTFTFELDEYIDRTLHATFVAFPNVLSELMSGVESILREPHGCFEQASSSTYPNIMALRYMEQNDITSPDIRKQALGYIERGYGKLTSYETTDKGFEWFGKSPPHEALTAYGLMEFKDMGEVYASVSDQLILRTQNMLIKQRDGNGGYHLNPKALDRFGRASVAVTNAYITYALSESGVKDIDKELDLAYKEAMRSEDAYELALVANTCFNVGRTVEAEKALDHLKKQMKKNGVDNLTADHSITRSGGLSLKVETASLVALALMKSEKMDRMVLTDVITFITGARNNGSFGSTQATILALDALTTWAAKNKRTQTGGKIILLVNGKRAATTTYQAGQQGDITLTGLEPYFTTGKQKVKVLFEGTEDALPYTLDIQYHINTPTSSRDCKLKLSTQLNQPKAKVGETVRLTTTLQNKTQEGLPSTIAKVGIPSGLSAQPWQLKELTEKQKIDFYEVHQNYIIFYFRQMEPGESKEIALDLKAELPGVYEAPASTTYLYYTAEFKDWVAGGKVEVLP